jgi:hypothetical protein
LPRCRSRSCELRPDEIARELRELDIRIQRSNWEVDLLD